MKKISLSLDSLNVDSFPTTALAARSRGTVHAASESDESYCGSCGLTFCLYLPTCGGGTCYPTEPDSCHGSCIGETCDCSADLAC
jgi:hypothetical protein